MGQIPGAYACRGSGDTGNDLYFSRTSLQLTQRSASVAQIREMKAKGPQSFPGPKFSLDGTGPGRLKGYNNNSREMGVTFVVKYQ